MWPVMVRWLGILLRTLLSAVRTRRELARENLALRQQLAVWKARQPRPRLTEMDRFFWVLLSRLWRSWRPLLCAAISREKHGIGSISGANTGEPYAGIFVALPRNLFPKNFGAPDFASKFPRGPRPYLHPYSVIAL
jgi:hypothetical protein